MHMVYDILVVDMQVYDMQVRVLVFCLKIL